MVWPFHETGHTGVCEQKHCSGEEDPWENKLAEHQIKGWIIIDVAVLQGKGSQKSSVSSQTLVSHRRGVFASDSQIHQHICFK